MSFRLITFLLFLVLSCTVQAQDIPSSMTPNLAVAEIEAKRKQADYILIIKAEDWMNAPSIATGADTEYLRGTLLTTVWENEANPMFRGDTVLLAPHCEGMDTVPPCQVLTGQFLQVWGSLNHTRGEKLSAKSTLIQIDSVLDAAILEAPKQ